MKKNESGRSMVEMVGVLAIAGLLTAAAFVLIRSGISNQKISQMRDEIDALASNVRGLVAEGNNTCSLPGYTDTWNLGTPLARAILKSDAVNPFGGNYGISRSEDKCDNDTTFQIYVRLPENVCETMAGFKYSGGGTAKCDTDELVITYQK